MSGPLHDKSNQCSHFDREIFPTSGADKTVGASASARNRKEAGEIGGREGGGGGERVCACVRARVCVWGGVCVCVCVCVCVLKYFCRLKIMFSLL